MTVPFKWYPGERVLTQAFLWRLLDLEEADGRPIDLVIATKFPSYGVRHPHKVVWLAAPVPAGVRLDRTELGQFSESAEDRATRRAVQRLDRVALGEARKVFATSQNVADRLRAVHRPRGGGACRTRRRSSTTAATRYERLHPLGRTGSTARSGSTCCSRRPPRSPALRGRDRRRRARTASGSSGSRATRAQRPGRVRRPRRRRASSPSSTRAASPSTTRRSTRTSGWSRTRRSSPRSPS